MNRWLNYLLAPTLLLMHGLLLLFVAPAAGWLIFGFVVLAIALLHLFSAQIQAYLGPPSWRLLAAIYLIAVGLVTTVSWLFVAFHHPGTWLAIGLATALLAYLMFLGWDSLAGVFAVAILTVAVILPTLAKATSLLVMSLASAVGLSLILIVVFAGELRKLGRVTFLLFFALAASMGANDVFYHGVDLTGIKATQSAGVLPLIVWGRQPDKMLSLLGPDLRLLVKGPYDRLIIGSQKGLFVAGKKEIRPLPLGAAADNASTDYEYKRLFVATRDGKLSLLSGQKLELAAQTDLPHGALVTRVAANGVYVLDEWRWVGLYEPTRLELIRQWPSPPVSDLLPDGKGGFYLSTLTGRLEHHWANEEIHVAGLQKTGVFHLLALDEQGQRLFATNMAGRRLSVFDTESLKEIVRIKVDRGCRNVFWDEKTRTLLLGSYFKGDLVALRGEKLAEVGRLHVGRRVRSITAEVPGRVLVVSAGGMFVVDLAGVFPTD